MRKTFVMLLLGAILAGTLSAAQQHPGTHQQAIGETVGGARELVELPAPMREHMLANMRDHMLALHEIQEALAHNQEDSAAKIAEQRLGLTSLKAHGAHELAKFMPEGMRAIGSEMHRSASRFVIEAQNAGVTDDLRPALQALAKVTAQCVACHAAYRLH
jgi:cytochrome c556